MGNPANDFPIPKPPATPPASQTSLGKPAAELRGLIKQYHLRLSTSSSSNWGNYSPSNLIDGNPQSTWFSGSGDSAATGKSPWVEIGFPEDVTIAHVKILGNRDPNWRTGYCVLRGKLTIHGADRKILLSTEADGNGDHFDFDFKLPAPVQRARYVRFTSLKD